jgi:hypothetical protein
MFKKLLDSAKGLADKAEIASKLHSALETTRQVAAEHYETSRTKAAEFVDGNRRKVEDAFAAHWPKVEAELVRRLVNMAQGKLSDASSIETAFVTSYELLPTPVRLLLPRQSFIDYCMGHRDSLLDKVSQYKSANWAALGYASQEQAASAGNLRLENQSGVSGEVAAQLQAAAAAPEPATKVCPRCAEDVKAAALVCRFCGHAFDAASPDKTTLASPARPTSQDTDS